MPRPKLKQVDPKPVSAVPDFPVVVFDGQEFEIHPISDRSDDYAYEDSARFLTLAIPLGSRVFNEILKLGADNEEATKRIQKAQAEGEDQAAVIVDLVGLLAKMDVGSLIDDVADAMPKLAAIACHYTDPDVTERDVKNWTKSPLNHMLWKAVIAQLKADNVLQQVGGLKDLMSEFGQAA